MAAFRDDMPLVVGENEDWDENTTRAQIIRPDWDFSPLRMRTMHHCPHIFFDTTRSERPDCPVLIPSNFSVARNRIISQDIYSYEPCGLPTGNYMPPERAQVRLMTASPVTLRVCIPAPDQVTPQSYFRDLNFYKQTRLSCRADAQSHFSNIGTCRLYSKWTIGSTPCREHCSATYCPCNPST